MVLVIDIGNTLVKFGIFNNKNKLLKVFRMHTKDISNENNIIKLIKLNLKNFDIEGCIISSVVKNTKNKFITIIKKLFNIKPIILSSDTNTGIKIKLDNPKELGSDMMAGAVGAVSIYKTPIVVADLGTATKMYIIDKNNNYIGGMITPGMKISHDILISNASLLKNIKLTKPKKVIGKNTVDAINSGIIFGEVSKINGYSLMMEKECGSKLNKILTGGYSALIKENLKEFKYEEYLVLYGLNKIYKLNKEN